MNEPSPSTRHYGWLATSTTPRFWLNLQGQYDLDTQADLLGDRLDHEVTANAS